MRNIIDLAWCAPPFPFIWNYKRGVPLIEGWHLLKGNLCSKKKYNFVDFKKVFLLYYYTPKKSLIQRKKCFKLVFLGK